MAVIGLQLTASKQAKMWELDEVDWNETYSFQNQVETPSGTAEESQDCPLFDVIPAFGELKYITLQGQQISN